MLIEVLRALVGVQSLNRPMVKAQEGKAGELGDNFCFFCAMDNYQLTFCFSTFPFGSQGHASSRCSYFLNGKGFQNFAWQKKEKQNTVLV